MSLVRHQGGKAIVISFLVAFMLMAVPLPQWADVWRPPWVTLVLIYWCLAVPDRVGVGIGWILGLFLDVMTGTLLGQHALGLTLVAFITLRFHKRVRVLPLWHQSVSVLLLVVLDRSIALWVKGIQGLSTTDGVVFSPALTSAILWPWAFIILRDVRRKYHVA